MSTIDAHLNMSATDATFTIEPGMASTKQDSARSYPSRSALRQFLIGTRKTPHLGIPMLGLSVMSAATIIVAIVLGAGMILWSMLVAVYAMSSWLWARYGIATQRSSRRWRVYLPAGIASVVLYPLLPWLVQDGLYVLVGASAALSLLVVTRLNQQFQTPLESAAPATGALSPVSSPIAHLLQRCQRPEHPVGHPITTGYESLVRHSSDTIAIIAPDGTIRYLSPSTLRLLGYSPDRLQGHDLYALVHPDDRETSDAFVRNILQHQETPFTAEFRMRHQNGTWRRIEAIGHNLSGEPAIDGIVIIARDVTERRQTEQMLEFRAFHDNLTGLPNRALFLDRVTHALARSARRRESIAILFIDLDNFKPVNDSFGHDIGDKLLIAAAERIVRCLRHDDTGARLGGDEFTILLEDTGGPDAAIQVAERILDLFARPFDVAGYEISVSTSIGIALSAGGHTRPTDLLREADIAMYQAKMRGKARIAIYDAQMGARVVERNDLESRMRHAIDRDEFKVYYQPQVELASGQISGFEALVRWESAEGELLLPDHFLPVAEESGLIVQLGRRVLAQAGRQATIWQQEYPSMPIRVSVNLSERQFQFPGLIDDIAAVLDTNALKPANLLLEVTESALMNVGETNAHTLRRLKELGVQLAIDDFGIGYSRLSNLKQYPVDVLKIDRSFVNRIAQNPEDAAIVGAITTLAHTLNTRVIAEGIETSSQLARLRDLGCDQGQGYLFASPLNADEASEMLAQTA